MNNFSIELARSLYESPERFPVDFDNAWVWLGYSQKSEALKKLKRHFDDGEDFSFIGMKSSSGGRPSQLIMLTIDCFKMLAMMAGTEQGKEVRKYFLECERIAKSTLRTQSMTPTQLLVAMAQQIDSQSQRLDAHESRLVAIEVEQERYLVPSGHKYTIMGYANLQKLEISAIDAANKGRKASGICKQRGIAVERIHDPRFGQVGLYPESILVEVFKGGAK